MLKRSWIAVLVLALAAPLVSLAQDAAAAPKLKVGDAAPDFTIPDQKGLPDAPKKLSDLKGKKNVLVAFDPKAGTPGCTTQMCGYRDDIKKFADANTEVIAISVDQQMDSQAFQETNKLPFALVGDPQQRIIEAYGVPVKDVSGNKFAQRSVFLVDKSGKIRYIDLNYNIKDGKDALYGQINTINDSSEEEKEP